MQIEVTPWPGNAGTTNKEHRRFDAELVSGFVAQCPFCGGDGQLEHTHTASYWIECVACGAEVHGAWSGKAHKEADHRKAAKSAIEAWNKRV